MIVTVNSSQMSFSLADPAIGQNLQSTGQILLSGTAGTNLPVTITSTIPGQLLLSTTPSAAGEASITLTILQGLGHTPYFYVQSFAGGGDISVPFRRLAIRP